MVINASKVREAVVERVATTETLCIMRRKRSPMDAAVNTTAFFVDAYAEPLFILFLLSRDA